MSEVWQIRTIGESAKISKGITYASADYANEGLGHVFLTIKCFAKGGGFNNEGVKYYKGIHSPEQELKPDDLLIAKTDLTRDGDIIGSPMMSPDFGKEEIVLPSMDLSVLRTQGEELELRFLFYRLMLGDARRFMWAHSAGSTVLHLESKAVPKFKFSFPSRKTQRHIVEILTTLDETIERTEALIAKYQQIKAGLMHDLFTRGVTPDGRLRPTRDQAPQLYKESPLGWIPKEWESELLDNLAIRGSGHTPNKLHPDYWNGGIKWVSLADSWRLDRVYISDTDNEISNAGIANSSAVLHPPGIVVLSRDAGVGKSAITTTSMAVSQHFMCWRCGSNLDNHYLYYWLQDRKREFENIATGSTIPTIGLRFFKHYRISAPIDISEQRRIGTALLSLDQEIFSLEADRKKKTDQKHGLMHDLLTGRVRVTVAEDVAA